MNRHVGAQIRHLEEICRVLKDPGATYHPDPNPSMIIEPNYQLMFLSWLPPRWRNPYLRLCGKGDFYDCEPPQLVEPERMLDKARMSYRNLCIEGWRETFEIEHPCHRSTRALRHMPDPLLRPLKLIIPTLI